MKESEIVEELAKFNENMRKEHMQEFLALQQEVAALRQKVVEQSQLIAGVGTLLNNLTQFRRKNPDCTYRELAEREQAIKNLLPDWHLYWHKRHSVYLIYPTPHTQED